MVGQLVIMLLVISSAAARSLEKDEALWHTVADFCSPALQRALFGNTDYPVGETRDALSEACQTLGLRHQVNLPGKHRYWRTVLLQFGFNAKAGATRLPFWLAGYNVPDTVKALLAEGGENSLTLFRELWTDLERWSRKSSDPGLEGRLRKNPWYPAESHGSKLLFSDSSHLHVWIRDMDIGRDGIRDASQSRRLIGSRYLRGNTTSH
jgi:hypothetical protein